MNPILIVCFFTALIHFAEASASCLRIAGVRTKQVATSLSFVNATLLISRMSNMLQAPFLGGMVDLAINSGTVEKLAMNFRLIILAAFVGNVVALLCAPWMVFVMTRAIHRFEKNASVPRLIGWALLPQNLWKIVRSFRLPKLNSLKSLSLEGLPKSFLILNAFMASIYAIGVLASLYAGAMVPDYRITASQLSAIVNGMATILFTIMIDPIAAHITDQAIKGKRPESDVRSMVFFLLVGRIVGVLLISQLLFLPASEYIKDVTLLIKGTLR
jgi:hypothetical protein